MLYLVHFKRFNIITKVYGSKYLASSSNYYDIPFWYYFRKTTFLVIKDEGTKEKIVKNKQ